MTTAEIKNRHRTTNLHSVEDVFNKIDNKYIDFYGEYGRNIVNARREDWNKEGFVNLRKL